MDRRRQIPVIARRELGGGYLLIFPTIPAAAMPRTTHTPALCWSPTDGHGQIDAGYYAKYTSKLLKDQGLELLRKYARLSKGLSPEGEVDTSQYLLAMDWTAAHDEDRHTESWKHMMHTAIDRRAERQKEEYGT